MGGIILEAWRQRKIIRKIYYSKIINTSTNYKILVVNSQIF